MSRSLNVVGRVELNYNLEKNKVFFSKAEYDEHKKTFKHFGCFSCQIDFYTQAELRQHWDHDQSCNAFTCPNCGGGFSLMKFVKTKSY